MIDTSLRRHAAAAERNRGPILEVLRRVLPAQGLVLELASGSGLHVVFFAKALPALRFQPSDPDPEARASIRAWSTHEGLSNVADPLALDATASTWPLDRADAVLCSNMIHIAPWAATQGLMTHAARLLPSGAPLVLYGPYRRGGAHTAPSNESFDASLRARDPAWGVRDLEAVTALAQTSGLLLDEVVEMPANNLTVVFRRE